MHRDPNERPNIRCAFNANPIAHLAKCSPYFQRILCPTRLFQQNRLAYQTTGEAPQLRIMRKQNAGLAHKFAQVALLAKVKLGVHPVHSDLILNILTPNGLAYGAGESGNCLRILVSREVNGCHHQWPKRIIRIQLLSSRAVRAHPGDGIRVGRLQDRRELEWVALGVDGRTGDILKLLPVDAK